MITSGMPLIFSYHTLFIANAILMRHERLIVKISNNLACHNFLWAAIKTALPYKGKKNDGFDRDELVLYHLDHS